MNLKTFEFIGRRLRPVELALFVKWLLNIGRRVYTMPDKSKFCIDPISEFGLTLMKDNNYEGEMSHQITKLLSEGDIFVDLGANEGYFSIIASEIVGESGLVIAIEPQERLWGVIMKNVEINGLSNIQLLPYAIGSESGNAVIKLYPTLNSGASTLAGNFNFKVSFNRFRKSAYRTTEITIKTLDQVINLDRPVKLIKIDIEGFELEALLGASKLLKEGKFENKVQSTYKE